MILAITKGYWTSSLVETVIWQQGRYIVKYLTKKGQEII